MGAKNWKILCFIVEYPAHWKNTTFLRNINVAFFWANCTSQLQSLDLGIINVLKCIYKKQFIWKTIAMIVSELFQDILCMKLYILSGMRFVAKAWRLVTPITLNSFCAKRDFPVDHIYSSDIMHRSLRKIKQWLTKVCKFLEWSLRTTWHMTVLLRYVESFVDQLLDWQVIRTEEESEEKNDKVAEDKVTFLDALKGPEVIRKYMHESDSDDGITLQCAQNSKMNWTIWEQEKKKPTIVID
jgi:DDE superfamily endonuclease.